MTRDEVAEIVHGMPQGMDADDYLVELVSRAIMREREACAEVCDEVGNRYARQHYPELEGVADECAGKIRERK